MATKPLPRNNLDFNSIRQKAEKVNSAALNAVAPTEDTLVELAIELIDVDPQIRTVFNAESIAELAGSITEHGQISPITVRRDGARYRLITGERRLRAVKSLGLNTIRAIVTTTVETPSDVTVSQLIENLQREDMGPLEIGLAYAKLMKQEGWSAEVAAKKTGKSARYVYRMISVADLPEVAQHWIEDGLLTDTYAIEKLSKLYKSSEHPKEITEKLQHFISRDFAITRAIVEGLSVPKKEKTSIKAVPLKDVPLTIGNAADLRRQKGFEHYEFAGMNFVIHCEFSHAGLNHGKPVKGAQVLPNIIPKDRTKAVVEFEGKLYEVPWPEVKIYETAVLGKKQGRKA